jgi:enoyl-[acyl-carrier-protein] reductase (NADH)
MGQELLLWKARHTGKDPKEITEGIARNIPLGRNATASDIADAVMFFVSEFASFITGVALDVDGGTRLNLIPGAR